ncbi:MAG: amidohydrolase [Sphingobacteriales bacterium]|nr:amidohydrolase [Sphingobacteriales bacterium]OJY87358.1 MAG: amidohydrolase [Sphingobacteriales bacterium 44-15]
MRIFFIVIATSLFMSCNHTTTADMIIYGAKIYTVDSSYSVAEAMAVKDGKILETGSTDHIRETYTATDMINAEGKIIYPGFIDGHAHFYSYALSLQKVNLTGTRSWEECISRIQQFTTEKHIAKDEWITGYGWDQNDWDSKAFPSKTLLDQYFPGNPIFLSRIDGHAAIVNQAALDKAGIKAGDAIAGGIIETKAGRLTGILVDNAMGRAGDIIPGPGNSTLRKLFDEAQQKCFAVGLTSVTDCGLTKQETDKLDSLQKEGLLKMKLTVLLADNAENYAWYLPKGIYKTDRMHIAGFKLFADGALGSRGACLLKPYRDKPGWNGFLLNDIDHYTTALSKIAGSPFQACAHAIGDSGNRVILQQFAALLPPDNDRRWRIEHAQVVDPADIALFGRFNIIPSVQPTHATSDMYWAEDRLGADRIRTAYAYKDLLRQNGWMALGTDFPVEDISPFKTFYAAVVRKDAAGYPPGGFQIENALTREEALRGMTIWTAKSSFEEAEKGSIEKGKNADFIIADTDLMQCEPAAMLKAKVLATYVSGEKVY